MILSEIHISHINNMIHYLQEYLPFVTDNSQYIAIQIIIPLMHDILRNSVPDANIKSMGPFDMIKFILDLKTHYHVGLLTNEDSMKNEFYVKYINEMKNLSFKLFSEELDNGFSMNKNSSMGKTPDKFMASTIRIDKNQIRCYLCHDKCEKKCVGCNEPICLDCSRLAIGIFDQSLTCEKCYYNYEFPYIFPDELIKFSCCKCLQNIYPESFYKDIKLTCKTCEEDNQIFSFYKKCLECTAEDEIFPICTSCKEPLTKIENNSIKYNFNSDYLYVPSKKFIELNSKLDENLLDFWIIMNNLNIQFICINNVYYKNRFIQTYLNCILT